jgi:hypothetical protein
LLHHHSRIEEVDLRKALLGVVCLLAVGQVLAVDEASVGIKVRQQSGANYVTGGIGEDAEAFLEISPRYPIHLKFQQGGRDIQEKGVQVKVIDVKGEPLVEAMAEGPLFYVNPPSGRWKFEIAWQGQTLTQTKDLTGRRYLDLVFDFRKPD